MRLRIRVHRDVRLVQVRHHRIGDHALGIALVDHRLLGDEDRHRRTLRIVVLARDVEDVGTDDLGDVREDLRQPVRVVHLVDVLDVALALVLAPCKTDVVDVEGQGLGEVVEALQLQARQRFDHVNKAPGSGRRKANYASNPVPIARTGLLTRASRPTLRPPPILFRLNVEAAVALSPLPYHRPSHPLMPSPATIERFLAHCHRRRYPSRTDIFRPGDPAGTMYYVVDGSVSIIAEE